MALRKAGPEGLREVVEREHPRDLAGLLAQLGSAQAEQRQWAARDLAAHPEAAPALGQALQREADHRVRQRLFTTLAGLASEAAAAALLPLLRSEDAELRNGAIEALAAMPAAVSPRIEALLRDADADVRIFTVNLLGELRHERVRGWLLQALQDEAVNVVAAAIEALAEAGRADDVPALQAARRRFADDPFIEFAATLACERLAGA